MDQSEAVTAKRSNLYRYTKLAPLIDILQKKRLLLLDPASWDDKNDTFYLSTYKEAKKLKSLVAACFTQSQETYHHWHTFASGGDGVRILFKPDFVTSLSRVEDVRHGKVNYKLIKDFKLDAKKLDEIPFMKRKPYEPEKEYRVIAESKDTDYKSKDVPIQIEWISRVTLSPWMHIGLAESVKKTLREIDGCAKLSVAHSTLRENKQWQSIAANLAAKAKGE